MRGWPGRLFPCLGLVLWVLSYAPGCSLWIGLSCNRHSTCLAMALCGVLPLCVSCVLCLCFGRERGVYRICTAFVSLICLLHVTYLLVCSSISLPPACPLVDWCYTHCGFCTAVYSLLPTLAPDPQPQIYSKSAGNISQSSNKLYLRPMTTSPANAPKFPAAILEVSIPL